MIKIRVPFLWVSGMAFFPFIFIRTKKPSKTLINHEKIHIRQQLEMGIVLFYIWYGIEYYHNRFIKKYSPYKAYRNICFECEAFENEDDLGYLKKRNLWSFMAYFRKQKK
jgi:hypothetical protein